ncbi:SGNH/GDSL hydrolase family protein [Psychromicrobium xiongbiense]|uniref:SGNH/GDSL hydrolase family protein n=1 Tax=Psychromicrobium xiongbiense TaxID=3051184 RepID=UPI002552711B|nr:SGNH/GDSL hydrolase family protein [Psychromicrobium sp. YIM S02556]
MNISDQSEEMVLFIGDSVTDCGRREPGAPALGQGYVARLATELAAQDIAVLNRGINGHRVRDLTARWEEDVLAHQPAMVSILVGINDTWRRYDQNDPTSAEEFEANYRSILQRTTSESNAAIVMVEPFLIPVTDEQQEWLEDLVPKIEVVHRLAQEFSAQLVPAQAVMTAAAREHGGPALAPDGVHPSALGHRILADAWREAVILPARLA